MLLNKKKHTVLRMEKGKGFVNPKKEQEEPPQILLKDICFEVTDMHSCPVYNTNCFSQIFYFSFKIP